MLLQMAVQERIGNIEQLGAPAARRGDGEHRLDRGRLDNWCERLVKIHASLLCQATNDPSCLVSLKGSIGVQLMLENPFVVDDMSSRRTVDETPCPILL